MSGLPRRTLAVLPLVWGLFACSSEDGFTSSVAGSYTVALTNGPSSCNWDKWEEGAESKGVGFAITQDHDQLTGALELDPLWSAVFDALFGPDVFHGRISGTKFSMTKPGKATNQGNCAYSFNATIEGTQNGDAISGTITYATVTNGNPDCSAVECSASQKFSGSRPPQ